MIQVYCMCSVWGEPLSQTAQVVVAHQVMIQVYCVCTVCGEQLSQTAQSFMHELLYGTNRSLAKARTLLQSLFIMSMVTGLILGAIGTLVPWMFPKNFPRILRSYRR